MSENARSAIAAALILIITGLAFYYLPKLMLATGEISPWLAAAIACLFVLAFFAVFWLRGRAKRKDDPQA